MTDAPALPDWPAMMPVDLACAYCGGVSPGTFLGMANRAGVRPVDAGFKRVLFRRKDLDRLIDSLPLRGAELSTPEPDRVDAAANAAEEALSRVGRRIKRTRRG